MASKSFSRADRIADNIKKELSIIIQKHFGARVGIFTISAVKLSKDFAFARVYLSVLNEANSEEVINVLEQASGFLRHLLSQNMYLRSVPKLKFLYDDTIVRSSRMNALIAKAVSSTYTDSKNDEDLNTHNDHKTGSSSNE